MTADNADLRWKVHLANQKAAWYQFQLALDIPEANASDLNPTGHRNQAVTGAHRKILVIDPGSRLIRGRETSGPAFAFDTGAFFGNPVYLGELRTDDAGRLIVLGGRGVSASYQGPETNPTTFANNDTWHDDTSDGPVTVEVRLNGAAIPVDPAWVILVPLNCEPYSPGLESIPGYILLNSQIS